MEPFFGRVSQISEAGFDVVITLHAALNLTAGSATDLCLPNGDPS